MAARELLWLRYSGAVRRYLRSAVSDPHDADDLVQEFGLALVRGDFHRADPDRGRFGDYLKTVLFRMVIKHRRRQARDRKLGGWTSPAVESTAIAADDHEELFRRECREHLLACTWNALGRSQPVHHVVLRFRAEHPQLSSSACAAALSQSLGRSLTATGLRQLLVRARASFSRLLVEEVEQSLEHQSVWSRCLRLLCLSRPRALFHKLDSFVRPAMESRMIPKWRPGLSGVFCRPTGHCSGGPAISYPKSR